MADAVATQILFDGERMAIMKFTDISDGTGETKVLKVDVSALTPNASGKACDGVTIVKIHALTHGLEVDMYWDATTDVLILSIPQNTCTQWILRSSAVCGTTQTGVRLVMSCSQPATQAQATRTPSCLRW